MGIVACVQQSASGEVDVKLSSAVPEGGLAPTMADGARWIQTDDCAVVGKIATGTKIAIRRGMMGSYLATIPGRPGFKVECRN